MKVGALSCLLYSVLAVASPAPAKLDVAAALASSPETDQLLQELIGSSSPLPRNGRRVLAERIRIAKEESWQLSKRQSWTKAQVTALLASIVNYVSNYWTTKPLSKVPDLQEGPSPMWPGARRKKIRYGPYRIPALSEKNVESQVLNVQGLMNAISYPASRPCDDDCILLGITADLEYDDGRPANTTNGAWLHHSVLLNYGWEMKDPVCGTKWDAMFESGNEKTYVPFALPNATMKTGYRLKAKDEFVMNAELMNLENKEKWAWLTLTYDYLDGTHPEYKDARVIWMNIGLPRCGGNSDPNPFGKTNLTLTDQPTQLTFTEFSMPWIAPQNGFILGGNGHMHEGGTSLDIYKNADIICTSTPHYSKSNTTAMGSMSHNKRQSPALSSSIQDNNAIEHIVKQDGCELPQGVPVRKGDALYVKASYDFTKHAGMKNKKGELDEVMGIVGCLVAFDPGLR